MATVAATVTRRRGWVKYTWPGLVTGDTITAAEIDSYFMDRSVQFSGTFAGGTSVGLNGSLIAGGAGTYFTFTDPQGNAISGRLAACAEEIIEAAQYIQPTIASGSADSVTVTVLCKRTRGS